MTAPPHTAVRTETVLFSAGRSRRGPLAWGQLAIVHELLWLGPEAWTYNEFIRVPAPPGSTMAAVLDAVRVLTERHEGLRTMFVGVTGPNPPQQAVYATGTVTVRVVDGPDDTTALAEVTADSRRNFGLELEWPVRWTVATTGARPTALMAILSHRAIDGAALQLLRQELAELLAAEDSRRRGRDPGWQPLDQAEHERSSCAHASRAAVQRWVRLLDRAPPQMFTMRYPSTAAQDFHCYELRSVAAAVALQRLSDRLGRSSATILVALTAVTVARLSGNRQAILKVVAGNRFDRRARRLVAPLVQDGIVCLDTEGSFIDVVHRAWPAVVMMYARSHYDPAELRRALEDYRARRGQDGDPRVALNDARMRDYWTGLPDAPDATALRGLCEHTRITHVSSQDRVDVRFFVEVLQSVDALRLTLLTDGRYVSTRQIPDILRGMEEILVQEAYETISVRRPE